MFVYGYLRWRGTKLVKENEPEENPARSDIYRRKGFSEYAQNEQLIIDVVVRWLFN